MDDFQFLATYDDEQRRLLVLQIFPLIFNFIFFVGLYVARTHRALLGIPIVAGAMALYSPALPLVYWLPTWTTSLLGVINPALSLGAFAVSIILRPFELIPEVNADGMFLKPQIYATSLGIIRLMLKNRIRIYITRTEIAAILFFLWCFVAAFMSPKQFDSLNFVFEGITRHLILIALFVLLMGSHRHLRTFRSFFFLGILGLAILSVLRGQLDNTADDERLAFAGQLGDPNDLVAALLPGVSPAIQWIMHRGKFWKGLGVIWLGLSTLVLFLSASRGGMLAFAVVFLWETRHFAWRRFAIPVALAGVMVLAAISLQQRSASEMAESAGKRIDIMISGVQMAIRHPITGVGPNQYQEFVQSYNIGQYYIGGKVAHNSWVGCAGETGLVGLLLFIAMFWYAFRSGVYTKEAGIILGIVVAITFLTAMYSMIPLFSCLIVCRERHHRVRAARADS